MIKKMIFAAIVAAAPAFADDEAMWPDLRDELFGSRALQDGTDVIALEVPYRTPDDTRTPVAAFVSAPNGLLLGKIMVIVDDNPMPVSAVFEFARPLPHFYFDMTMRINASTPLHIVAETTDGQLFVSNAYIKTSGTGACSAPPGTDPELALETLGEMELTVGSLTDPRALAALSGRERRMDVGISHPSHSGMQKDQISLLFIPFRYVENLAIDLDGQRYVDMTGSITLSENPKVTLSIPNAAQSADVTMTDTSGTVSHAHKDLSSF